MRKPARLRRGDTIGVLTPASAVREPERLSRGLAVLETSGFRVRMGRGVGEQQHYLAGDDAVRLRDWVDFATDPDIKALIAARGGYGSGRLLPQLDTAALWRRAKPVVGHSDLTFLLNDLVQRAEMVAFHGPMAATFGDTPEAAAALLDLLCGGVPPPAQARQVLRDGEGEGVLVGGCLSILVAMLGTPYALPTRGRLLFVEDVNEAPFRIDRMLTHLKQAGALDGLAGLVFGEMHNCFEQSDVTLADIVADVCGDADYPIVLGLDSGHGTGMVTLPLGARARLAGDTLVVLEPVVA